MNDIIVGELGLKLEQEFEVVISCPWEGNSLILRVESYEELSHLLQSEGSKVLKLVERIQKELPDARLREMRTKNGQKGKKLFITFGFSSKEELDRLCADPTIKIKELMTTVSVTWEGEDLNASEDYEESLSYFNLQGGSNAWRALALIKHLKECYESVASLNGMRTQGKRLYATLRFSARDKEDFDLFCAEHSKT